MKVILISNIDKLGKVGDAVEVTQGYARNFLLSKGLAVLSGDVRAKQAGGQEVKKKNRVRKQKESKREKRLKRQKSKEI